VSENKNILVNKPQINISYASGARMGFVSLCAFLCILQSAMEDGGNTLIIALTTVVTALIVEFLLTWRAYGADKIKDGSAVVTALVLTLLLPNTISPVYSALGAAFAVTVVKYSFGGLGSNWLNPALGGWLLIRFSWASAFTGAVEKGAASISEISITSNISALDNSVTEFLNNTIFSISGISLPSGYIDLLFNNNSAIIADRGLLFLLAGTIIVTAAGINRGLMPLVFLSIYGFLIRLAGDLSGLFWNGDIIYGFFSGGTIAAAFILAVEPASGTKSKLGMIFTVILSSVIAWLFRYKFMEYSGCFMAIAIVNCFSPVIRFIENELFISRNSGGKTQENAL